MKFNNYAEYQQYCARYSSVITPLNEEQFNEVADRCALEVYAIGCDVHCGIPFKAAKGANQ